MIAEHEPKFYDKYFCNNDSLVSLKMKNLMNGTMIATFHLKYENYGNYGTKKDKKMKTVVELS